MIKKDIDCSKYNGYIKSVTDLIYVDEYRTSSDTVKTKADEMYENGSTVKEIVQFCNKERLRKIAEKLKKEANLSKRFITRTFANYNVETPIQKNAYDKAKNYVENIDQYLEDGTGIIFVGNGDVGTGKTHLACAIANELLESGCPVKVINVAKMIYQLKEDFKVDEYINVPRAIDTKSKTDAKKVVIVLVILAIGTNIHLYQRRTQLMTYRCPLEEMQIGQFPSITSLYAFSINSAFLLNGGLQKHLSFPQSVFSAFCSSSIKNSVFRLLAFAATSRVNLKISFSCSKI